MLFICMVSGLMKWKANWCALPGVNLYKATFT